MTIARHILIYIFVILTSCNIFTIYAGDAVPVLIWGGSVESDSRLTVVNPLLKTTKAEFTQILNSKVDDSQPPILVFMKDSLCVEDLTQHKEDLRQATKGNLLAYLPAVQSPLSAFEGLDIISEIYRNIKESSPNLIGVLTGRSCGYSRSERVRRDTDTNSNSTEFIITEGRVLLYSSELPSIKLSTDNEFRKLTRYHVCNYPTNQTSIVLCTTFNGFNASSIHKIVLLFNFEMSSPGYYSLKSITYKENNMNSEVLLPAIDIVFPYNFSYHCSQNITFSKNTTAVKIADFQIQIDAKSFGDAYDCVNFTTIPIWTGIFVTVILGLIMMWALAMIIDIRTMDRFDDPKGKTITISAQE
ncbi:hypothetical protein KPH14_008152 [Odynerus spinipes]|uniref:V-type proton ATPase subunit S1 n=1 Tax=Odynerus spinipes TaxID=1348599 RepID=A0AAD9R9H9_9HYME|nr:hypothetical protein KPH14_008152 [Odynerus spinipes]